MSTFLEDLALVRRTQMNFVPRVWDLLSSEAQTELNRRLSDGADLATEAEAIAEVRSRMLGDRYLTAMQSKEYGLVDEILTPAVAARQKSVSGTP